MMSHDYISDFILVLSNDESRIEIDFMYVLISTNVDFNSCMRNLLPLNMI